MRVPSRAPVLLSVVALATALGGCGGAGDASDSGTGPSSGTPLRGLEARRNNAPAVLAAVEKIVGVDDVLDLTFEKDRFTVLTSWVTAAQHENPADDLQARGKVPGPEDTAAVCRAIGDIDPGAAGFITGNDGTELIARCPQNARSRQR